MKTPLAVVILLLVVCVVDDCCASDCSSRLSCSECTKDDSCVWCNSTQDNVYACHDGGLGGANDVCDNIYYWWQCTGIDH
jgi:hypothetical protein